MVYHISAKKIVKDLMITLNKYRIDYRIDIKNINKKQSELYNKNIIIFINEKNSKQ